MKLNDMPHGENLGQRALNVIYLFFFPLQTLFRNVVLFESDGQVPNQMIH